MKVSCQAFTVSSILHTFYELIPCKSPISFAVMMKNLGTEWLIDATGCRANALQDVAVLQSLLRQIITELDLQPVSEAVWHQFPDAGGITGVVLLAESHLTCHTWPVREAITLNLYCCRAESACEWNWQERLCSLLGAQRVSVRAIERGGKEVDSDEKETPAQ